MVIFYLAILGWSQMLQKQHLSEDRVMRALETIKRNARSQTKLIEDILDISQYCSVKARDAINRVFVI
ncbi:MAG: histidine kinase dimerization/phospho-acceptor domain-containing protein [Nostoc sp.]